MVENTLQIIAKDEREFLQKATASVISLLEGKKLKIKSNSLSIKDGTSYGIVDFEYSLKNYNSNPVAHRFTIATSPQKLSIPKNAKIRVLETKTIEEGFWLWKRKVKAYLFTWDIILSLYRSVDSYFGEGTIYGGKALKQTSEILRNKKGLLTQYSEEKLSSKVLAQNLLWAHRISDENTAEAGEITDKELQSTFCKTYLEVQFSSVMKTIEQGIDQYLDFAEHPSP